MLGKVGHLEGAAITKRVAQDIAGFDVVSLSRLLIGHSPLSLRAMPKTLKPLW
jgi:hypothetical protein